MFTYYEVSQFLFLEARLMDSHAYDEWLALWSQDAHYWIPCNNDDGDPKTQIALVNESKAGLEDRVRRLKSGAHYPQDPKSRLSRVVSNIEVIKDDVENELLVGSAFNLTACRKGRVDIVAGRSYHKLFLHDNAVKITSKKVLLVNNDEVINNLTYLV